MVMANKLVVFDLDGTLIDSAGIVAGILNSMRVELGLLPISNESFLSWISLGGDLLVSKALDIKINHAEKFTRE